MYVLEVFFDQRGIHCQYYINGLHCCACRTQLLDGGDAGKQGERRQGIRHPCRASRLRRGVIDDGEGRGYWSSFRPAYWDPFRAGILSRLRLSWQTSLKRRHNERDGVSNQQPHDCLFNRLFKAQIKENIKARRHWPLWGEFTGDFPVQRASNAENVSIWWCHHVLGISVPIRLQSGNKIVSIQCDKSITRNLTGSYMSLIMFIPHFPMIEKCD